MKEIWDQRYKSEPYYYGTEPNEFFRTFIDSRPPGKLLLPGAGEGRNAVYAADAGWEVDAFDFSPVAREKALRLAKEHDVDLHYSLQDARHFNCRKNYYDVVAIIFLQLPAEDRQKFHQQIVECLNPEGGNLYLIAFSRDEKHPDVNDLPDQDLSYSKKDLLQDFKGLHVDLLQEEEVKLDEGPGHQGKAKVVKITAIRRQLEQESDKISI